MRRPTALSGQVGISRTVTRYVGVQNDDTPPERGVVGITQTNGRPSELLPVAFVGQHRLAYRRA
ncbi:hypothetical protein, partial [Stenotrophomonas sp. P5_B8]